MTCKFCQKREADKKNTHYLTDGIIRSCLNEDGANVREKGYMFEVSNSTPFIDFNFQRETSQNSILEALGREPTEEEIANAKQIAYSVDYVFCRTCEGFFTEIEEQFSQTILPRLRGNDLTGTSELSFPEKTIMRQFFLLQVWRTSICDPIFNIPPALQNELREILFDKDISEQRINAIPLNVTYLNTLGDDFEYTKNLVGIGIIDGNYVIFFNDFTIQVFENEASIKYVDIYGINAKDTFNHFTNRNEESFIIKVINNTERIEVSNAYFRQEKVEKQLNFYKEIFQKQCLASFGQMPSERLTAAFINGIIHDKDCTDATRYTADRILKYSYSFFERLYNYR
ncbi:hypothetical protein [Asinibacterium sp. OR53]|uniref:hypothetical protein n=1 Tax=Asinibacterium sp. OR53 TaxID=925409 RepID=UPI00047CCE6E|nr:hypothetical protein [Asinibacterium sp. OR53]